MGQVTFASLAWDGKKKRTRREIFLAEMDAVIPWVAIEAVIAPHYPQAGKGRRPLPLTTMLRIYFLQQWYNLSDPAAEEMLYDSEALRRFARIEFGQDVVPDESTILHFRHLLEEHALTAQIFDGVGTLLQERGLLLRAGTLADATLIAAPPSTKNAAKARDPEMTQTRKGKQWHFGMKFHIGTDRRGIVHHVVATTASTADVTVLPQLLHGEETAWFGDQAYWRSEDRAWCAAHGVRYRMNIRGTKTRPLTEHERAINRSRSRTRARCEHPFRIVKQLWGFTKVRYRGLAKNLARGYTMFALANLYQMRYALGAPTR